MEISITAGSEVEDLLDYRALKALDTLEQFVQKNYATGPLLSPLTFAKFAHMASNQANPKAFVLPSEARYKGYEGSSKDCWKRIFCPHLLTARERGPASQGACKIGDPPEPSDWIMNSGHLRKHIFPKKS
ncbi:hypothetical protein A3SI_08406 [Nitritalea halalkaliphila LW7]|uniref:Uncharacterized protein n=1 Tax=Nitritalea halalkaliphila LW7 TaxID=1189621 RepID=I5C537_9BACT|nr:hypothetical protein [Nitritalea halalkaliphila]EIM76939.1 hypothetical protein A3SI_08406 [Nitritalea halalkaliphila LW7]